MALAWEVPTWGIRGICLSLLQNEIILSLLFYMMSPKLCYCLLVEIGCWCRWAFAPVFMHFLQVETQPGQKAGMSSPPVACSLMFFHSQEGEIRLMGERREQRLAVSYQSTLTGLGGSWLQGDNHYCLLSPISLFCRYVPWDGCQENKDFLFVCFVLGMWETI